VAIDVAIEFAVSWNPFVKSKTRAVTTTTTTSNEGSTPTSEPLWGLLPQGT
jgi:hypothetical protein